MSQIRVIAIAVIARPSDGALLVYDGYDTVKGEAYHRPLGGGIEFGETAEAAVRREIREEIGQELAGVALLGFLENLFVNDGKPGHQIVAVLAATLVDPALYARDEIAFTDNGVAWTARWRCEPDDRPLYPDGLAALLSQTRRTPP